LAKISHDEVVLIELQGSLEVESNHPSERDGKHVGKLRIDEATVRFHGILLFSDATNALNTASPHIFATSCGNRTNRR
jgi:hypothetical protein